MPTSSSRRILVTRAAEDAVYLSHLLAKAGFEPVEVPLLQRTWQVDAVAEAARHWRKEVDLVLVTSPTTAEVLGAAVPQGFPGARIAAVGPGTGRRLRELGFPVDLMPEHATAASLAEALGDVEGLRIAYPRADLAHPALAQTLIKRGADLLEVVAYINTAPLGYKERVLEALPVDATTLMSSSAASRIARAVPPEQREALGRVFVIGPSTERTARHLGLPVYRVASQHTLFGMMEAVQEGMDP